MKKMTAFCLAVMMSLSLFGCSQAQQVEGITIVDQGGRKVTLEKPAEKVASGYYIATTTIIGLGGEDMLTGVEMKAETRPIYKAAASKLLDLPALGNKKMFHVEECAKADPDVVFLPVSLKEYAAQLEELGIATVLLNPETQEQYDEAVQIIARYVVRKRLRKIILLIVRNCMIRIWILRQMTVSKYIWQDLICFRLRVRICIRQR